MNFTLLNDVWSVIGIISLTQRIIYRRLFLVCFQPKECGEVSNLMWRPSL